MPSSRAFDSACSPDMSAFLSFFFISLTFLPISFFCLRMLSKLYLAANESIKALKFCRGAPLDFSNQTLQLAGLRKNHSLTSSSLCVKFHNLIDNALVSESGPLRSLHLFRVTTCNRQDKVNVINNESSSSKLFCYVSNLPRSGLNRLISMGMFSANSFS